MKKPFTSHKFFSFAEEGGLAKSRAMSVAQDVSIRDAGISRRLDPWSKSRMSDAAFTFMSAIWLTGAYLSICALPENFNVLVAL